MLPWSGILIGPVAFNDGQKVVKRRDPLAEREAKDSVVVEEEAAGRTGGGTERAIVYDDAALDKLLDRSDLERGGQHGGRLIRDRCPADLP